MLTHNACGLAIVTYSALTQSVFYVLKPRFAPKISQTMAKLESHFEKSHSVSYKLSYFATARNVVPRSWTVIDFSLQARI